MYLARCGPYERGSWWVLLKSCQRGCLGWGENFAETYSGDRLSSGKWGWQRESSSPHHEKSFRGPQAGLGTGVPPSEPFPVTPLLCSCQSGGDPQIPCPGSPVERHANTGVQPGFYILAIQNLQIVSFTVASNNHLT